MATDTRTMKAVRFYGQKDIRYEDIEHPYCHPGYVRVRPAFVGICGTDLHEYTRGATLIPTAPHPLNGKQAPVVMGHEISGVVEELGQDVQGLEVGDNVVIQPIIADGTCGPCREGRVNCCVKAAFIGLSSDGGLCESLVIPARNALKIPHNVSLEVGGTKTLVEPLSVAWHAVRISPMRKGDIALVLGAGPIGIGIIQALALRGAKKIIVSEISSIRREWAKSFGADIALDPTQFDLIQQCQSMGNGQGVHVAYDTVGIQNTLNLGLNAVRTGGTFMNIAIWGGNASIAPNEFAFSERRYMGTAVYVDADYAEVINALASGRLCPERMITKKIKLSRVVEEGILGLIEGKDQELKIIVDVGAK